MFPFTPFTPIRCTPDPWRKWIGYLASSSTPLIALCFTDTSFFHLIQTWFHWSRLPIALGIHSDTITKYERQTSITYWRWIVGIFSRNSVKIIYLHCSIHSIVRSNTKLERKACKIGSITPFHFLLYINWSWLIRCVQNYATDICLTLLAQLLTHFIPAIG